MRLRPVVTVLAMLGGVFVAPAIPASAAPLVCEPGYKAVTLSYKSAKPYVTHVEELDLAPGTSFSQSYTLDRIGSVTAGIDGTGTVSTKANAILAKADAEVSVSLHLSGSRTTQSSYTRVWTISSSTSDRAYALYRGTTRYSGSYAYKVCTSSGRGFGPTAYGTYASWSVQKSGTALCPRSRYASNSIQYVALTKIGC